jgi:site-specific recombinase XerC
VYRVTAGDPLQEPSRQATEQQDETPLSKATLLHLSSASRLFFWLAGRPGFRSRVSYSDADYFNLSAKDTAVAKADHALIGPTLEPVRDVLAAMPADTDVERRDRALIALILLTGARDNAIASLWLKHVDLREGKIVQDARDVRTKGQDHHDLFLSCRRRLPNGRRGVDHFSPAVS